MTPPTWLHFFQRTFPSANMTLIRGTNPVLIDTGFGSDFADTERLLREAGVPPENLSLVVNTHYHGDHAGGNHSLQTKYNLPIATGWLEARMINGRDKESCNALWLNHPIEPYFINCSLKAGDTIDAGGVTLEVLHTPGHTLGHIALYESTDGVLICGDVAHSDDVAWINPFREGVGTMQRFIDTLETLLRLPKLTYACSGHGPFITDPQAAIRNAIGRYEKWLLAPEKMGWHACKRIFTYALMIFDGMTADQIREYLLDSPWFYDYSRFVFDTTPEDFVQPLIDEVIRSGAANWRDGRLYSLTPHNVPPPNWHNNPPKPHHWPQL